MRGSPLLTLLVGALLGCGAASLTGARSAPEGEVLRGPVTPVCRIDVPCDAGFSALFHVLQGGVEVTQFGSDAAGRFHLAVPPGTYTVVPDSTAPLMAPAIQSRTVTVAGLRLIPDTLVFDTGIR